MQSGLHAVGLGFQRLGIAVGIAVIGAGLAYVLLVFGIIAVQGFVALTVSR